MEKGKISEKQFFLVINGPSCGGKSAVADALCERYGEIYNGKSDKIKWLISDYNPSKYRGVVHEMALETIRVALKNGLSVIKEGAFKPEQLTKISKDYNVPIFFVDVSAPMDILEKRFEERIEKKKQGAKISNTSHKRFEEIYNMYLASKIESPLEFDSSILTPDEMQEKIVRYIREKV